MKQYLKRALGVLLALALVMSFMPMATLAAAMQTDIDVIEQEDGIPEAETPGISDEGSSESDEEQPIESDVGQPVDPDEDEPTATPAATPDTITQVRPELAKMVDKPLVKIVYHYFDAAQNLEITDFADYTVSSTHSFYALAKVKGNTITIAANKFPGKVTVSTASLRFRVLLNGNEDITALAEYNAATGLVSLPNDYMGHDVTIDWYCPVSEVTELPVKVTICTWDGSKFITTTETLRLQSNTNSITVPLITTNGPVVSQNGIALTKDRFTVKNDSITIAVPALGGDISVSAYALAFRSAGIGVMPTGTSATQVNHTRSDDQIYYGFYTSYYTANGNTAFCLDPTLHGINDGTYPISRYLQRGTGNDLLIKCAYYLYGGPGYNGIKNSLFSNPDSLVTYGLCHAVAAYAYLGDDDAFKGLGDATVNDLMRVLNIVNSQPMPPSGFDVFIYNEGSSTSQPFLGWDYTPTGDLEIIKSSSNPSMSDNNSCYSLEGAVFDVYDSSNQKIGSITTNANGRGKLEGIPPGSGYYIVEVKPPKGYAQFPGKINFIIVSEQTTTVPVSNIPQNDPIGILLQKLDADTSTTNPQGNAGLAGAEFTIKYYKGLYSTAGQLSSLTPARTWVVRTDANGAAFLDPAYLVSGDPFYYAGNNDPTVPLGTLTVQETKAPVGYQLNNELFIRQITGEGTVEHVHTYNAPNVKDDVIRGGVSIEKWDFELNRKATPQGDATLAGSVLDIYNRSLGSVVVNGTTYAPGAVVFTLNTDSTGSATTSNNLLPYGDYEIVERTPPTGYLNTGVIKQTFEIRENGVIVSLKTSTTTIKNHPIRGGVEIEKWDFELNRRADPQGDGTLAGSVLEIWNRSPNSVLVGGTEYAPNTVVHTMTTNDEGWAGTANNLLPYGSYEIVEKTAPTGYLNTGVIRQSFQIRQNGVVVSLKTSTTTIKNHPIRGGAEIEKWDIERDERTLKQGDATLEGAILEIWNRSPKSVMVGGVEYAPNTVVYTMTTNTEGWAGTSNDLLPYGSYEIIEKSSPTGYLNTGIIKQSFQIREHGVIVNLKASDKVIKNDIIRGGVRVEKWDNEIDEHRAQGGATLENAVFEIVNRSLDSVLVQDVLYEVGEVVFTFSTDSSGVAITPYDLLPYGTYEVREIEPPEGYLATGVLSRTFTIREHEVIVDLNTSETAIKNNPIRGDLRGVKISDGDANRMANVPFRITSVTTGENHVIVTDRNGEFNTASSWNPHSQNTNRGETDRDGIWFGELWTLNDDLGALLYDTYLIEELPCEANKDKELLSFEVAVYRHNTVISLGTLTNDYIPVPEIFTTAMDQETTIGSAYASESTTIIDTVYYSGLKAGKEYTLKGILMDQETGEPLLVYGKPVTAETKFRASAESGSVMMKFTFSSLALKGKSVVVFESLEFERKEVASHADIDDEGQTITFVEPEIGTSAAGTDGESVLDISTQVTLVDTVSYENLIPGLTYTVKGTLMDKATGKPLLVDDKEVTAETTFKAESESGTVEVTFTFSSVALLGKTVVVFESLFYQGQEIAVHADIEDQDQSVTFKVPKIGTTATGRDGSKVIPIGKEVVIIDTVAYSNLAVGETYVLKGVLMDKATGKPLLVDGKEIKAETTFKPQTASGTAVVTFTLNSTTLRGKTVVVFETLEYQGQVVTVHADIEDQGQTVTFSDLKIGTSATGKDGKKIIPLDEKAVIVDVVTFSGLTISETYTVKGILMDKATGKPLMINGNEITSKTVFVAGSTSGSVEVIFTFNSTALAGKTLVVFESLEHEGVEIAAHYDLSDEGQTVTVESKTPTPTPTPTPPGSPQTGRDGLPIWLLIIALVAAAGSVPLILYIRKRGKQTR